MDAREDRSRQLGTGTRLGLTLVVLALLGATVGFGTWSAFSDTTENASNQFATGTVVITDDDGGSAMFNTSGMTGGDTVTECIEVTYSGSLVPADVSLYGTSGGSGLADHLDVDVEIGSGGAYGDCSSFVADSTIYSGTLANFSSSHTDFASGLQSWSPAANPESKAYRFTVAVQDVAAAQGLDATATFTWEAQG